MMQPFSKIESFELAMAYNHSSVLDDGTDDDNANENNDEKRWQIENIMIVLCFVLFSFCFCFCFCFVFISSFHNETQWLLKEETKKKKERDSNFYRRGNLHYSTTGIDL